MPVSESFLSSEQIKSKFLPEPLHKDLTSNSEVTADEHYRYSVAWQRAGVTLGKLLWVADEDH